MFSELRRCPSNKNGSDARKVLYRYPFSGFICVSNQVTGQGIRCAYPQNHVGLFTSAAYVKSKPGLQPAYSGLYHMINRTDSIFDSLFVRLSSRYLKSEARSFIKGVFRLEDSTLSNSVLKPTPYLETTILGRDSEDYILVLYK